MLNRLILFLIRQKLHLKKWVGFRFVGQKSKQNFYFFDDCRICKVVRDSHHHEENIKNSNVSLNYLLSDECKIELLH